MGKGEKIGNTGVCVKEDTRDGESDWHKIVNEIFELECSDEPFKIVVLFTCEWYDLIHPKGTCKHNHYKIIEINYTKRYENFDQFIIA